MTSTTFQFKPGDLIKFNHPWYTPPEPFYETTRKKIEVASAYCLNFKDYIDVVIEDRLIVGLDPRFYELDVPAIFNRKLMKELED